MGGNGERGMQGAKPGEKAQEPELKLSETVPQAIARMLKEIEEARKQGNEEAAVEIEADLHRLENQANKK